MGISDYVSSEGLKKLAYTAIVELVLPAIKSIVEDSSNVYDDAAYAVIEGLVDKVLDKLKPEEATKPEFMLVRN